ncbi:MAG: DUF423 domain-containing protein [Planctomycetota bacterium]
MSLSNDPVTLDASRPSRRLMGLVAVAGASAVAIGAFGAHGLSSFLSGSAMEPDLMARRLAQFETGARYHLVHAVVLLALTALPVVHGRLFQVVVWLVSLGILLFSGSLYILVLTNTPLWGAVTPLGGLSWIIAWCLMAFLARRRKDATPPVP